MTRIDEAITLASLWGDIREADSRHVRKRLVDEAVVLVNRIHYLAEEARYSAVRLLKATGDNPPIETIKRVEGWAKEYS